MQHVSTYHRTGYHILEHHYLYNQRHEDLRFKRVRQKYKREFRRTDEDWLPAFTHCITIGAVENRTYLYAEILRSFPIEINS
jgi:hypothetical protein